MNTNEFFYWLQGFFELRGGDEPLTIEQAVCIKRHIDLVRATSPQVRIEERVAIILGMVSMIATDASASRAATAVIRDTVAEQFQHVIDPSAGDAEQQAKLNLAHGGKPWKPGEPVMRC